MRITNYLPFRLAQRKKSSLSVLSTMLKDTFKDFDLLDDKAEPRLETIASRVVQAVGDYGLFSLKEPINYPEVNVKFYTYIQHMY